MGTGPNAVPNLRNRCTLFFMGIDPTSPISGDLPRSADMQTGAVQDRTGGPFTVWIDNRSEGWHPSEPFDTLVECFDYLISNAYGHPYQITREVRVVFNEDASTWCAPRSRWSVDLDGGQLKCPHCSAAFPLPYTVTSGDFDIPPTMMECPSCHAVLALETRIRR